ncbi:hypothetical protein D3C80_1323220 [compost metagenome]
MSVLDTEARKLKFSKRKKRILAGITLLLIAALGFTLNSPTKHETKYSTDIEPISNRFPNLKNIQRVYWSGKIISDGFGPTSYWMRGYVFLDHASIMNLKATYTWEIVSLKPKLDYDFHGKTQKWSYSSEFDFFIMSTNYVGKFYLDVNSDTLYFEIEQ